jgi:hypothetical protein
VGRIAVGAWNADPPIAGMLRLTGGCITDTDSISTVGGLCGASDTVRPTEAQRLAGGADVVYARLGVRAWMPVITIQTGGPAVATELAHG